MSDDSRRFSPVCSAPTSEEGHVARGAGHGWQQRARESLWVRLSLVVGVMVVATVAIFMLPKIASRSAGLQTRAEVRTDLWRQELVESGRVTRETARDVHRMRDLAIIAALVTTAGIAVAATAYVALRPRDGQQQPSRSRFEGGDP